MRKNCWIALALVLILPAMLFTVSCAKKAVEAEPAMTEEQPMEDTMASDQDTAEQDRLEAERIAAQQQEEAMMDARNRFVNEDIYFAFDSSAVEPTAQRVLTDKADYMSANQDLLVTVEGHCDERGTDAYNLALGQRRADAAKDFMVNLGIDPGRMTTISYGEERPADPGHNEEAWAKNRRAHFVIE